MAFPTLGVLDNFNAGANQALTSRSGWGATAIRQFLGNCFTTDSAPTEAVNTAGTSADNYWNATGANSECWYKIGSVAANFGQHGPCVRIQNPTAAGVNFYCAYANDNTHLQIYKIVSGAFTAIGTNVSGITLAVGDSVGIDVVGTQVSSYYRSGAGAWVQKDTLSDSSITGSGYVAGVINDSGVAWAMTDFGGGALASANFPISCAATQAQLAACGLVKNAFVPSLPARRSSFRSA